LPTRRALRPHGQARAYRNIWQRRHARRSRPTSWPSRGATASLKRWSVSWPCQNGASWRTAECRRPRNGMPAAVKVFVDTNTLLYVHDRDAGEKSVQALQWLHTLTENRIACLNLQVLNELTYVLLRKRWFASQEKTFAAV